MKRNLHEFLGHFHNNGFWSVEHMETFHDDENDDEAEEWKEN